MEFSSHSQRMRQRFQPGFRINQSYYPPIFYPQLPVFHSYNDFVNGYDQQPQQRQFSDPESECPLVHQPRVFGQSGEPSQPAEGGDGAVPEGVESRQVPELQNACYPVHLLNMATATAEALLAQTAQMAGVLRAFLAAQSALMGAPGLGSGPVPVLWPEPVPGPMHAARWWQNGGYHFRGRGRVRKGNCQTSTGTNLQKNGASSSQAETATAAEEIKSKGEIADPSADIPKEVSIPPQTTVVPIGSAVTEQRPAQSVCSELCGVDCDSLKILEVHMNGKQHEELQRLLLLDNANKPGADKCKESVPLGDSNPELHSMQKITSEENKRSLPEHLREIVLDNNHKMEIQQSNGKADLPCISKNSLSECLVSQPDHHIRSLKCNTEGALGTGGSPNRQRHGAFSSHSEPSIAAENVKSKGEIAKSLAGTLIEGGFPPRRPVVPSKSAVTKQKSTRNVRCELCGVDYDRLRLEHVKGKRHQKKLRGLQPLNTTSELVADRCKENLPLGDSNTEVAPPPKISTVGDENKESTEEHLPTTVLDDNPKMENQQSNDKADLPQTSDNSLSDCPVIQPGPQIHAKRKREHCHGEKQETTVDSSSGLLNPERPEAVLKRRRRRKHGKRGHGEEQVTIVDLPSTRLKPEKPEALVPFICELCNVKCYTAELFNAHLFGEMHISKFKRFQTNQAIYETSGLQTLYPSSAVVQNLFHQQGSEQAFHAPQASCPPLGADVSAPSQTAIPAATGTVSEVTPSPNQQTNSG